MRRVWLALVPTLFVAPVLWACADPPDKPKAEATQSPAEAYRALVNEYDTAQKSFMEAYQTAKTEADQLKLIQEKAPQPDKFAVRFLDLAEKNPHDAAALDSLVWVCTYAPYAPQADKALEILRTDHAQSDKLVPV